MKNEKHLPFIGIFSTLHMRRSYLECSRPTAERERESITKFGSYIHTSVFFLLVGDYEHSYLAKGTQSRNECTLHGHASCTIVLISAKIKICVHASVLLLLVGHCEHSYRVKETQSRNKRTLYSHAS